MRRSGAVGASEPGTGKGAAAVAAARDTAALTASFMPADSTARVDGLAIGRGLLLTADATRTGLRGP